MGTWRPWPTQQIPRFGRSFRGRLAQERPHGHCGFAAEQYRMHAEGEHRKQRPSASAPKRGVGGCRSGIIFRRAPRFLAAVRNSMELRGAHLG
jgi:hypothetical protein